MTRLPRIIYAVPRTLHVHLEIAKAIQTLAVPEKRQQISSPVDAAPPDLDTELIKRCASEFYYSEITLMGKYPIF